MDLHLDLVNKEDNSSQSSNEDDPSQCSPEPWIHFEEELINLGILDTNHTDTYDDKGK